MGLLDLLRKKKKPPARSVAQEMAARRGTILRDEANCVCCGLCQAACDMGALRVDREGQTWTWRADRCVRCGLCVDACPREALQRKKP